MMRIENPSRQGMPRLGGRLLTRLRDFLAGLRAHPALQTILLRWPTVHTRLRIVWKRLDLEMRRWYERARPALPVAGPLLFSLSVHGLLMVILITTTWSTVGGGGGGYARAEVVINLPAQSAPEPPDRKRPAATETFEPAAAGTASVRLQGLSNPALASAPALRSTSSSVELSSAAKINGASDLLRSQDDSFIGGATFAGQGTRQASSVVYVVDASGAMITSLQFVLAELERSVGNLSSSQQFQVVLFRDRSASGSGTLYEVFTPPGVHHPDNARLVHATPANKVALSEWLQSIRPAGRSNPIEGLRRGLSFRPDAIFLLSRSIRRSGGELSGEAPGGVWGQPPTETLAELEQLNPRSRLSGNRRVVIKAIQFIEEDPTGTMQAIGNAHGDGPGSYSVLTLQALGGR